MNRKDRILGFEFARKFDDSKAKPRENGAALIGLILSGFLLLAMASPLLAQNNPDWTKPFPLILKYLRTTSAPSEF